MKIMTTIYAEKDMVLTDGEIYGTTISLEQGRGIENFYEISKKEYEDILSLDKVKHLNNGDDIYV
jgi:hypothetical protein